MKTQLRNLLTVFCLVSAGISPAATITWTNTSGGAWSATNNWSPNTVPSASDDVFITASGTYTVVMDVSPSISSLTLGGTSGVQTLTNSSKTLTVSLASLVDTNGVLGLNNGTLAGAGALALSGVLNWNGGSRSGGGALTVLPNGKIYWLNTVTLADVVTNQGTINWLGGQITLSSNGPSATGAIWNQAGALIDIQCDQVITYSSQNTTLHNAGLLRKRVATGNSAIYVILDNAGTVQAQTGTITISGGSNLGGTFQANSGATISINAGAFLLNSPPDFQGPGTVQFATGSSVTLNAFTGTFSLSGLALVGQNSIASNGIVNLIGDSNGGGLGAGASLIVLSNGVLNLSSSLTLGVSGVLTNQGTINWLDGQVTVYSNALSATGAIWNQAGAVFDIQCDQAITTGSAPVTFHNAGLLRKRTTSGTTTFLLQLDNTGTVQAQTGTLAINSGSTLAGTFQANAGANINFAGSTFTLTGPPNFQGPGTVQFVAGSSITLSAFTGTFSLNGSTLAGQSTISTNGIVTLNGCTLNAGASLTTLPAGVLNWTNGLVISGSVTNQGTITWLSGPAIFGSAGTIWNQAGALFDVQCDQSINNAAGLSTFHNGGLLRKSATAGTTTFGLILDNSTGTVLGQTGVLLIGGSYVGGTNATLATALAGPNAGTGFGKIQFTTTNSLLGKFNVAALGGYRPSPGSSFLVLSYPAATNDFTCMNGLDLGGGLRLVPRPSAAGLSLVAANYAITASPNPILDRSLKGFLVSWPTNFTGWILLTSTNLASPSAWVILPIAGTNNTVVATVPQQYFRLMQ